MSKHEELIGEKVNGLEILEVFKKGRRYYATFKCHCGNEHVSQLHNIKSGQAKSCGCRLGKPKNVIKSHDRPKSKSKLMMDGLLEVFETGEIIRSNKYGEFLCPQYNAGRSKNYLAIRPTIDGKQKTFYVHRLIAEAFVPNPNNYTVVSHKDGNNENNHPSNLMWTTKSGAKYHAFEKGFTDPYTNGFDCLMCQKRTRSKAKLCPTCKRKYKKSETEAHQMNNRIDEFSFVNLKSLTKNQQAYAKLAKKGLSNQEIAKALHVNRSNVQQILSRTLRR